MKWFGILVDLPRFKKCKVTYGDQHIDFYSGINKCIKITSVQYLKQMFNNIQKICTEKFLLTLVLNYVYRQLRFIMTSPKTEKWRPQSKFNVKSQWNMMKFKSF